MKKYTVESVEESTGQGWTCYVANVRILNDVTLYRIGPAYSPAELVQKILDRFGK